MKAGVVIFPGSNCDRDLIDVLSKFTNQPVEELWHKDPDLKNCSHIFLPGGFSYGDYLRSGAIAGLSPVMQSIKQHAASGGFVMGICNGFQILCETGLLPGALLRNENVSFICENVYLKPGNTTSEVTRSLGPDSILKVPVAHGEGRFYCDAETLKSIEDNGQVIFRYCEADGSVTREANINGSLNNIAGICNSTFNVFGMMPHPERCASDWLLNMDGSYIFNSVFQARETV